MGAIQADYGVWGTMSILASVSRAAPLSLTGGDILCSSLYNLGV